MLKKSEATEKVYEPLEKNIGQIKRVFATDKRIIGLVAETDARGNYEVESQLLKNGRVAYSTHFPIVEEAVKHFQRQNLPSRARWRYIMNLEDLPKLGRFKRFGEVSTHSQKHLHLNGNLYCQSHLPPAKFRFLSL